MKQNNELFFSIGTMSGTSMDGVDVALIQTNGEDQIQLLAHHSLTYPKSFHLQLKELEKVIREEARKFKEKNFTHEELLEKALENFAEAKKIIQTSTDYHLQAIRELLQKYKLPENANVLIGYHGQTLYHNPLKKVTLQVGDSQYLADQLQMQVVSDFRQNDVKEGGQGAPFAPLLHRALILRDQLPLPTVVINCGGIANISVVTGKNLNELAGFDTGPGNVLLDQFIRERTQGKETMDTNGNYALRGKISLDLLEKLFSNACIKKDFYQLPAPKSLDTSDFKLIDGLKNYSLEDGCATLAAFTAQTIALNIKKLEITPKIIILAGGGWNHPVICREFIKQWPLTTIIKTADEIGWLSSALEAQIFAYFAVRSLLKKPLSLPLTTGVKEPTLGGKLYCASSRHACLDGIQAS